MDNTTATPSAQPRPDRFLMGIVVGLAALVLAAGISVLLLRQPAPDLPAGTPAGTVQRFYAALEQKDYVGAYKYLSDNMTSKPTVERFASYQESESSYRAEASARIQDEKTTGSEATVTLALTTYYDSGNPFGGSSSYSSTQLFTLRQEGGTWRITGLPGDYLP